MANNSSKTSEIENNNHMDGQARANFENREVNFIFLFVFFARLSVALVSTLV